MPDAAGGFDQTLETLDQRHHQSKNHQERYQTGNQGLHCRALSKRVQSYIDEEDMRSIRLVKLIPENGDFKSEMG